MAPVFRGFFFSSVGGVPCVRSARRYAEHGIATFPVRRNKKPLVRNYQRIGLNASAQLVAKFADESALGFMCGKQSRIVIIDIDTDDEQALREALRVFGSSRVIYRTGSGHFAIWYRWSGETRRIRPLPDLPIDILGGGFAIVPPSLSTRRLSLLAWRA